MRVLVVLILAGFLVPPAAAQQDWKQQLAKELVTIKDGKMVYEEYDLAKITLPDYQPVQLQLKIHSEAPANGVISRDNFVALTSSLTLVTFYTAYAQTYKVPALQFLQAVDFTELTASIGTPDIELNLFMTDEGLQFEWVNTADGKRNRWTSTWAEVYAK